MILAYLLACGGGGATWVVSDLELEGRGGQTGVVGRLVSLSEGQETAVVSVTYWSDENRLDVIGSLDEEVDGEPGKTQAFSVDGPTIVTVEDVVCAEITVPDSNIEDGEDLGCLE